MAGTEHRGTGTGGNTFCIDLPVVEEETIWQLNGGLMC